MCGIAGLVSLKDGHDITEKIRKMVAAIPHRGPDGEGVLVHENVALGHRRLAIIDLTEDAAQPMSSPSGELVLSFNGEIYNYVELRAELAAKGRHFRSESTQKFCFRHMMSGARVVLRNSMACGPLPFSRSAITASFVLGTGSVRSHFIFCNKRADSILDRKSVSYCRCVKPGRATAVF